jgi:hypothetical protein
LAQPEAAVTTTNFDRYAAKARKTAAYPARLAIVRPAPPSLEKPEADLWRTITGRKKFDDPAHLDMLEQALIARGVARKHLAIAEDEGPCVKDRFDQLKMHPAYKTASAARREYLQYMRALKLDVIE